MKKFISTVLIFVFSIGFAVHNNALATTLTSEYFEYEASDNAYIVFDEYLSSNNMGFIDAIAENITDPTSAVYSQQVKIDSLGARRFEEGNYLYFSLDSSFFSTEDTDYLISVVYYDYLNGSADFKLEYTKTGEGWKTVQIKKENRALGWNVATVGIEGADFSKKYVSGPGKSKAAARIICPGGADIRKIEIANISKLRRNNTSSDMKALGSSDASVLKNFRIIDEDDTSFDGNNLWKTYTLYDLIKLQYIFTGNSGTDVHESYKQISVTQKEVLQRILNIMGYSTSYNYVDFALNKKIINAESFFLTDNAPATYYNVLKLINRCLFYDPSPDDGVVEIPLFKKLLESGQLNGMGLANIQRYGSQEIVELYLYHDKVLPYTVHNGIDSLKYNFVNYYGERMYRPYVSQTVWNKEGNTFVCFTQNKSDGMNGYHIYTYNVETRIIHYIGDTPDYLDAVMGEDDYVYFLNIDKTTNRVGIWKRHSSNSEAKVLVYELPDGFKHGMIHISNDCRYMSIECANNEHTSVPENTRAIIRIDLQEKTFKYTYHSFKYSNTVNHMQVNPVYPELMFFSHETNLDEFHYRNITDRANIIDIDTGKRFSLPQGCDEETDYAMLFFSHERWGYDGEHLYITNLGGTGEYTPKYGIVRFDKDGTHGQFYSYNKPQFVLDEGYGLDCNHSSPSGDGKYCAVDAGEVFVFSTESRQVLPIADLPAAEKGHPYHGHAVVANHKYIVNWGDVSNDGKQILGVGWYDFTDFDAMVTNAGGRFSLNEDITYVKYHEERDGYPESLADISNEVISERECLYAPDNKKIYFDIDENIIDAPNESMTITFDYFDDSNNSIVLTYTKGVENEDDRCRFENMQKTLQRTGSNTWKTAEVTIESGNFENIGTYSTDFNISGDGGIYVTNVKASQKTTETAKADVNISSIKDDECNYTIEGEVSRKNKDVDGVKIFGVTYDDDTSVINMKSTVADLSVNPVSNFTLLLPKGEIDEEIKLFFWKNDDSLAPLREKVNIIDINLYAESKANGVSLSWDKIEGADAYDVYRDGVKIATTTEAKYDDKYFATIEELHNDHLGEYTAQHTYNIVCKNQISKFVRAGATPSYIKYISFEKNTDQKYQVKNNYNVAVNNTYASNVEVLNKGSNGITMSSKLPESSMGDLKPFGRLLNSTGNGGKIRNGYSCYFWNLNRTQLYVTSFVGSYEGENAFYSDNRGLRLVTGSTIPRNEIIDKLASNPKTGENSSFAVSKSSTEGYAQYSTKPFGAVESFGDTKAEEYVVLLCASMADTESVPLFEVTTKVPINNGNTTTDSSWEDVSEAVPYANGTDELIEVYHGMTGRKANKSFYPKENNKFNDPIVESDSTVNRFSTFVFNIKACFSNTLVNTGVDGIWENNRACDSNIRFIAEEGKSETAIIKSIGFVKPEHFIK